MEIPPLNHPRWREVVSGTHKPQFEALAVKVLLGRLTLSAKQNSSDLEKYVVEFREMFTKNATLPSIQRDLQKIFG